MASIQVASIDDLPVGTHKIVTIGAHPIAIFNIKGTLYAIDDTCSHADASLGTGELDEDEMCVECPLHGSLFDLRTGKPRTLPAYEPVATHTVWVENNLIFVDYLD